MKNRLKIPEIWDDCKTKEQKEAFIKELDRIDKTSKFIPFDELLLEILNNER